MGIRDLTVKRMSVDEILAELGDDLAEILRTALVTRKKGTSRFFEFSGNAIVRALADDGFDISRGEIDEWRRENVD